MFQNFRFNYIHQVLRYPGRQPIVKGNHLTHSGLADARNTRKVIICRIWVVLEVLNEFVTYPYRVWISLMRALGIFPISLRDRLMGGKYSRFFTLDKQLLFVIIPEKNIGLALIRILFAEWMIWGAKIQSAGFSGSYLTQDPVG